ncbi:MAG: hypothetical protein ACRDGI_02825 [Candidatus Limnocylindrales bacterium]
MTDPLEPREDPELDRLLDQVFKRKADRAVATAPSFESLVAKRGSYWTEASRLIAIAVVAVLVVAGSVLTLTIVESLDSSHSVGANATVFPTQSPSPPIGAASLARPLDLPSIAPGAACPVDSSRTLDGVRSIIGTGPIYPMTTMVDGTVFYDPASYPNPPGALVTWIAREGFLGPVLVRGKRLDASGALAFGAAQLPEQFIPTTDIPTSIGTPGWVALEQDLTVISAPGCYGYQFDGPDFSRTLIFEAMPSTGLVAALQRPLRFPLLAGAACPTSTPRRIVDGAGPGIGAGPVYSVGYGQSGSLNWAGSSEDGGWFYVKILWLAEPGVGPILIRGAQLDGTNKLGFGSDPVPVPELVLEARDAVGATGVPAGWLNYVDYTRVRAAGCYAYQIDFGAGTETIAFEAGP